MLREFVAATQRFETAVLQRTLTPELLKSSLEACAKVLALIEFNGMLPLTWYREKLAAIFQGDEPLKVEDFYYAEVMPHRLLLRRGKLRLVRQYLRNGGHVSNQELASFIRRFGYLDPGPTDPLMKRPTEDPERVLAEVELLAKSMTVDIATAELRELRKKRLEGRARYTANLGRVARRMEERGYSVSEIRNFISALTIVSLATTEEEFRHIWQDRFWRALGAVARGLSLSVQMVSGNDIIEALSLRSTFTPDTIILAFGTGE
jgi:hypothetical protein